MTTDLVISHYRVLEPIGEGGMGEVYRGIDETLRRQVALKSILPEHRLNPTTKARFLREARTLSQLDHPNICRVYDYIETAERDWIVLELVEGQTLGFSIRTGLRGVDRVKIAQQIAAVLVATLAAGVVHRDLKPGNVMLTPSGDVKVLDFGLSAIIVPGPDPHVAAAAPLSPEELSQAATEETRSIASAEAAPVDASTFRSEVGVVKGTVAYMSPEQARGELATPASDMFAYGLVLQEIFTGRRPHGATADYAELLDRARRGESTEPDGAPPHIAALVRRLKSFAPAQRPTAVDTLARLRWIADSPRRARRNVVVAALVLAAIAGAAKYTFDLSRERNAALIARDEAQQRRAQAENLIGFMVGDLRTKLTAVGRLEILDDVGKKALEYFASVKADTLTDEELYRRSQALHQLGQVRQARADLPGALQAYEDSLAQAEAVVRRHPENAEWQLGLGTSHFYVGDLKLRGGDLPSALSHFQVYQQIAQALAGADPDNPTYQLELSYGHSNVAAIYSREGNLVAAREQLEIVSKIQKELTNRKPSDTALAATRANNLSRLGIVQDALGQLREAADSFRAELDIYEVLLANDARNMSLRRRLEVSHQYRALVMRALGRDDEAMAHLQTATRETLALTTLDSTNATWQRDMASSGNALGRLELERGNVLSAQKHFQSSLAISEALARKNPTRATEIRDLAAIQ
ncbi:MAG: protein kinase, partial [Acidobacteriota bacterium]